MGMMKIQSTLILLAVFNTANLLPLRIKSECRNLIMKGFPFSGKDSVTMSEMVKNFEKTGLGADFIAYSKIQFQEADQNKDGHLEIDEAFADSYKKLEKGEYSDFKFIDTDKDGLIDMTEYKSYGLALNAVDPNMSEYSLKQAFLKWTGPDGKFDEEEYKQMNKFSALFCSL